MSTKAKQEESTVHEEVHEENIEIHEKDSNINVKEPPVTRNKVKIRVPISESENNDLYVSVNNETFLIQRGKTVEVPDYVAEVIENSENLKQEILYKINEEEQKQQLQKQQMNQV